MVFWHTSETFSTFILISVGIYLNIESQKIKVKLARLDTNVSLERRILRPPCDTRNSNRKTIGNLLKGRIVTHRQHFLPEIQGMAHNKYIIKIIAFGYNILDISTGRATTFQTIIIIPVMFPDRHGKS